MLKRKFDPRAFAILAIFATSLTGCFGSSEDEKTCSDEPAEEEGFVDSLAFWSSDEKLPPCTTATPTASPEPAPAASEEASPLPSETVAAEASPEPSATATVEVSPTPTPTPTVASVAVTLASSSVDLGACSGAVTITTKDSSGSTFAADRDVTLTLTENSGNGYFYSDSKCWTLLSGGSTSIASGSSSATVYYKSMVKTTATLTAAASATDLTISSGTGSLQINQKDQVFAGKEFACYLFSGGASTGTAKCWGTNGGYQLGDGTQTSRVSPVAVSGLSGAVKLALGDLTTCALTSSGGVKCWGYNSYGTVGSASGSSNITAPANVSGLTSGVIDVTAGAYHACALLGTGAVKCWGYNNYGQLGNASTTQSSSPVAVSGIDGTTSQAVKIAAGQYHTCALLSTGSMKCWGNNSSGALGNGTTTTGTSTTPAAVTGISSSTAVTQITAGDANTCVLLETGAVKCWGSANAGQLGNSSYSDSASPVSVSGISTAASIGGRYDHFCAQLSGGTVKCWGYNYYAQLGNGNRTTSTTPTTAHSSSLTTVTSLAAGNNYSCAVIGTDSVKCWGSNGDGQLGNGKYRYATSPVQVSGITTATHVALGANHACARLSSGAVQCWGWNRYGALGSSSQTSGSFSASPVDVSGITTASDIAAGGEFSCSRLADGTIRCWGDNVLGQLGDGSSSDALTPVSVSGINTAAELAVGYYHSCARLSDNTVKCWGDNYYGQLGDGTETQALTPVAVNGISTASDIAAGIQHNCARLSNGTVKCWGYDSYGALGDNAANTNNCAGSIACSKTPALVSGLTASASSIYGDGGGSTTCAVLGDGTVQCWGSDSFGTLMNSYTDSDSAIALTGVTSIASGSVSTWGNYVLSTGGALKAFGLSYYGALGTGSAHNSYVTSATSVATSVSQVASSGSGTCYVKTDGTVWCAGDGYWGQLGNGSSTYIGIELSAPTSVSGL